MAASRTAALRVVEEEGQASPGLRERKKARLREQIFETAIGMFRKRGYRTTRVEDVVRALEISQPTFFRYFPDKESVLREVGKRGFVRIIELQKYLLSVDRPSSERLSMLYASMARDIEADPHLWRAVVLAGGNDPLRSSDLDFHRLEQTHFRLLRESHCRRPAARRSHAGLYAPTPRGVYGRARRDRGS